MDAISKLEELSKLNNIKLISLGSKGALSKAWYCINDDIVLVKGNSLYSYEPFSEAYASILADLLGFEHISYWLDSSLGYFDVVTYSDIGYVSLCKYYALDKGLFRLSFFDYVCEKCKGTAIKPKMLTLDEIFEYLLMLPMNIQQKIFEILHFDSIICNVDRHMRNIELVSNKHGDIVDVIPILIVVHRYSTITLMIGTMILVVHLKLLIKSKLDRYTSISMLIKLRYLAIQ